MRTVTYALLCLLLAISCQAEVIIIDDDGAAAASLQAKFIHFFTCILGQLVLECKANSRSVHSR